MVKKMKVFKRYDIVIWLAYLYILIPFIIFVLGWLGLRYSIPAILILAACYWKACREDSSEKFQINIKYNNILKIFIIALIIFIWVYFSGIGRCVFQNSDHSVRNSIFEILVSYEWPIKNYEITNERIAGANATSLIYYIGFWLPSALVGKIFGIEAGYTFQMVWAILGLLLFYYLVCARLKRLAIWPLIVIVFFSGLDIIGEYLMGINLFTMENDLHLEWWIGTYQFSSMTTQLFWVFNQSIPAWICTMLAFNQKNNRNLILILACCMIQGTLPFVGLLLLVLFWCFNRKYDLHFKNCKLIEYIKKYLISLLRDTLTLQNFLGGGIVGIISFGYLIGNRSSGNIMQESIISYAMENNLLKYIIFILVEIGAYFIILYRYHEKDKLYYFLLCCLCVIPPIKVGNSSDFCMRASIPALLVLTIYVLEALSRAYYEKNKLFFYSLIVVLLLGSFTPIHEFTRTIKNTVNSVNNGENPYIDSQDEAEKISILNSANFSGVIDNNWFYKYIVK